MLFTNSLFSSRHQSAIPQVQGEFFSLVKIWFHIWGQSCLNSDLAPCTDPAHSLQLCSELEHKPIYLIMVIGRKECVFQEGFFPGSFQIFIFLYEDRSADSERASESSAVGAAARAMRVTAVEVLTSSDLWRHTRVQLRAWEGKQGWLWLLTVERTYFKVFTLRKGQRCVRLSCPAW